MYGTGRSRVWPTRISERCAPEVLAGDAGHDHLKRATRLCRSEVIVTPVKVLGARCAIEVQNGLIERNVGVPPVPVHGFPVATLAGSTAPIFCAASTGCSSFHPRLRQDFPLPLIQRLDLFVEFRSVVDAVRRAKASM